MKLDKKIKTALDETRLLILGSQVLFGFMFQSVVQEGFKDLAATSQYLLGACLTLMVVSIGCLIAPSMQHRIVEQGQSTRRLEGATSRLAEWSLVPLLMSLGLALFVVFDRIFGSTVRDRHRCHRRGIGGIFLVWPGMADWRPKGQGDEAGGRRDAPSDQDRANADGGPGYPSRLPGAAWLSIHRHAYAWLR